MTDRTRPDGTPLSSGQAGMEQFETKQSPPQPAGAAPQASNKPEPSTWFGRQQEADRRLDDTVDGHSALSLEAQRGKAPAPSNTAPEWSKALHTAEGDPSKDIYATYGEDMLTFGVPRMDGAGGSDTPLPVPPTDPENE